MSKSVQDILAMIEEHNIQMVDFKMVDINGQFRHVTIPASHFGESTLTEGIGCALVFGAILLTQIPIKSKK